MMKLERSLIVSNIVSCVCTVGLILALELVWNHEEKHGEELAVLQFSSLVSVFKEHRRLQDTPCCPCDQTSPSNTPTTLPCPDQVTSLDICAALDESGSICELNPCDENGFGTKCCQNFDIFSSFLANTASQIAEKVPDSKFGLVTFEFGVSVDLDLAGGGDLNTFVSVVEGNQYSDINPGGTNTGAAIQQCVNILLNEGSFSGARGDATKVLLLLTDGLPTGGPDPRAIADSAKNNDDIVIVTLGVGLSQDDDLMRDIASPGAFVATADFEALDSVLESVVEDIACGGFPTEAPSPSPSGEPLQLCTGNIDVTVTIGPATNPNGGFVNVPTAQSLANVIDCLDPNEGEVHTQASHVWWNPSPLELIFQFGGIEYELQQIYFWNYFTEQYDVDQIDFTFYDQNQNVVGAQTVFPITGRNAAGANGNPIIAEQIDLTPPVRAFEVSALLTGTNGQLDFQNFVFQGSPIL